MFELMNLVFIYNVILLIAGRIKVGELEMVMLQFVSIEHEL